MVLHPLDSEARCPYCGKGGLAFVRQRRFQGDLYRCTNPIPCIGLSFHYRRNGSCCGIAAEAGNGFLLRWNACPGQQQTFLGDTMVDHLTTAQVAARLQVDSSSVIRLLASGKLIGTKVKDQWRVPSAALREYIRVGPLRRRVAR